MLRAVVPARAGLSLGRDAELRALSYLGCSYRGSFSLLGILGSIPDAVLVSHSSQGCDADFATAELRFRRRFPGSGTSARMVGTSLTESDVIFGIERRLSEVVDEVMARYAPRVVFVRAKGCAAGRSGWEVQEEINLLRRRCHVPILLARCDALRERASKHHPRLHDDAWRRVPGRQAATGTFFNKIEFGREDEFSRLLDRSGLPWNSMAIGASWDAWERSGSAKASLVLSSVEFGDDWSEMLARDWKVPATKVAPYGFEGTRMALKAAGEATCEPNRFRFLSESEEARFRDPLKELRNALAGKRILPLVAEYWGDDLPLLSMLGELGAEVPGLGANGERWESLLGPSDVAGSFYGPDGLGLGRMGGYKLLGLLKELAPDAVVAMHNGVAPWCARLGIPVLEIPDPRAALPFQGMEGLVRFGQKLSNMMDNPLFAALSRRPVMPYRREWLATPLVRELP